MRSYILLLLLLQALFAFNQSPATDDSIMAIRGKWKTKAPFIGAHDPALKPASFPQVYKKTNAISALVLQTFPEVRGADPSWYVSIHGKPYFMGAPSPYQYSCLFKYYFYSKGHKKIMRHEEPGTGASVYVNAFRFLLDSTGLSADINGRQERIYEVCNTEGEWKGYPVYRINDNSYENYRMVLLTKDGRLPWKPVSQLQYLQAYRSMRLRETKEITDQLDIGIAKARKDLEKMKADKRYAGTAGENIIAAGQKAIDMQVANREKNIKTATALLDEELEKIERYIHSVPAGTLQQQAMVKMNTSHKLWNGFANPLDKSALKIVYVDRTYFDTTLASYEPQFMTLAWYWLNATASLYFKSEFEQKFPVEKLQAMVRNDRAPSQSASAKQPVILEIEAILQSAQGPNNQGTWTNIQDTITEYLTQKWKEGHLQGTTPVHAFYIKADRTTMTQNDIDSGKLIVEVGLAFIKPSDFVIHRFERKL